MILQISYQLISHKNFFAIEELNFIYFNQFTFSFFYYFIILLIFNFFQYMYLIF